MSNNACDRAFDLLTRSAPLTLADQGALDVHLAGCPSCRAVAQAWAPALDLLSEVRASEEPRALLSVTGHEHDDEHAAWQAVESQATVELATEIDRETNARRWYGPLGLAAAVLIGCLIGGLWQMSTVRPAGLMADAVGDARYDALALDSLPLVEACWMNPVGEPREGLAGLVRPTRLADVQCCTYCHAAGKGTQTRLAQIEQSCRVCHLAMR